ncbi:uncharacterized protein METZ01_LOCUS117560 [marine metagenome]|uniref:Uncharacterized protein n=1 Tax=marine metagenome TaxID=408172 RepID=A0A381XIX6_9ZZZZ
MAVFGYLGNLSPDDFEEQATGSFVYRELGWQKFQNLKIMESLLIKEILVYQLGPSIRLING